MLSWQNRKPQKSEYERLTDEYEKKFGKPWVERVGFNKPVDAVIKEIRECIESGQEQKIPQYTKGIIY